MDNIAERIRGFKRSKGVKAIIAFSGGADEDNSDVKEVIRDAIEVLRHYQVAILTGGTQGGIPEMASAEAADKKLPTIGIFPIRAQAKVLDKLDLKISVDATYEESDWGDESSLFAKVADGIIVIGGGAGTSLEFAHAMKLNEKRIKDGLLPTFVVPIKGFGGVADIMDAARIFKPSVIDRSIPHWPNYGDGAGAAFFLIDHLKISRKVDRSVFRRFKVRQVAGFEDLLPDAVLARQRVVSVIEEAARSRGFLPMETPALEYTELLEGMAGEQLDTQLFKFVDCDRKSVSLRYDHTIPLARVMAQYKDRLTLPFKRYQVGPVWRMETDTRGSQLRQFTQFDFDIVGSPSPVADLEILLLAHSVFSRLSIPGFKLRITNWKLWAAVFQMIEAEDLLPLFLCEFDKQSKTDRPVDLILDDLGGKLDIAQPLMSKVKEFLRFVDEPAADLFQELSQWLKGYEIGEQGLRELKAVYEALLKIEGVEAVLVVDIGLTRGSFEYYTGLLYEISQQPALREASGVSVPRPASLAGGGRYDNLLQKFSPDRREIPAVGGSIGLERLILAMDTSDPWGGAPSSIESVVAATPDVEISKLMQVTATLSSNGLRAVTYPDSIADERHIAYARSLGAPFVVILSKASDTVSLSLCATKNGLMITGLSEEEVCTRIRNSLSST